MGLLRWKKSGAELADYIKAPRTLHLVVISTLDKPGAINFDAAAIAAQTDDWADVITVPNGSTTFAMAAALPPDWNVYGTAARIYPIGAGMRGIRPGHYLMARAPEQLHQLTEDLLDEVLGLPNPARLRPATPVSPASGSSPVTAALPMLRTGRVTGFLGAGERAVVDLEDGIRALVRREDLAAGTRLDWLLAIGAKVEGSYDPATHVLDVSASAAVPRLLQAYSFGQVILALVVEASAQSAVLSPLPGELITVTRPEVSSNELDDIDSLLAPGQVVAARLTQLAGIRHLVLVDVDDAEAIAPAPPLLTGQLPWLQEGRDLLPPSMDEADELPTTPPAPATPMAQHAPAPPVRHGSALHDALLSIERLKAENRALRAEDAEGLARLNAAAVEELAHARADLGKARDANRRQAELLNKAQEKARKAARSTALAPADARAHFEDPDDALRHEIYLAWVSRVPAAEKPTYPWDPGFLIGPRFTASYFGHEPALRAKTAKALVDLVTHRAERMPAREVHPKRTGPGGDDPQQVRADGAACWRMSVEVNVAAARRVHYWKLPDGRIELHELVAHDVFGV
ncbi:hypothetical protein [Paeniglutamicibacter cryotolerans]|uniref:S1 motif domain-containing protein n=1 Tax=Paeniglutamicibacter cryotolerans TaxID=670079 RepID=A0A839QLU2_9MICC|nr:hypothetical protein [Paeniglutamicibacter cryotolerans]MBB2995575.1 hypothetical protein [Paeniglutamicibacter cryotolerans]